MRYSQHKEKIFEGVSGGYG